jgi:hypothetical protein
MKCEECVEAGEKSRVTGGGGSRTLMGHSPYYDEDGIYHNHDPNTMTSSYSCSNGHRWVTKGKGRCPADGCDHGGVFETIRQKPRPKPEPGIPVRAGWSTGTVAVSDTVTAVAASDDDWKIK